MAGIKISDLPARTTVDDTMTLAVDTGTNTYKITVGDYNHSATETARQYANASATSATESAASAASAQNSLNQVITVAGNAATSASNAAASATEAAASATSASGFKEDSESWANGQRGGVDVPNTDPAYHNNSKYYSEQSAAYSVASKGEKEDSEAWAVGTKNGAPVSPSDPQYANSAKHWAQQAAAVAHIDPMDNDTMGIGIPDGRTTEATNGTFSAIGTTALATINPNASADYASDWLLDSDNNVITPDARYQYRVSSGGSASLYYWTGSVYTLLSGGGGSGHTIMNSSAIPMAGMANLQFGGEYDPVSVENVVSGNKTIVHGQVFICESESDWNTLSDAAFKAKYGADRVQVGVYWHLPWANSIAYQTDLTPVGTVLSLAVDTTNTTIFPADLIEFPNKDYVICRGATVKITDYPLLYQYFADKYGDGNYFGTAQTAEGYFVLPNWSADFPTNGVLVIKARVTSDVITFAEVDDEAVTSENVWSAEKTKEEIDDVSEKASDTMTYPSNQYSPAPLAACSKYGSVVKIDFSGNLSGTIAGNGATIATLPEGYRPNTNKQISVNGKYGNTEGFYNAIIGSNGEIKTSTGSNTYSGTLRIDTVIII